MHQRLDTDRPLFLLAASIIAGPFTERAFVNQIVRMHKAFERDLGISRNRKPCARAHDHVYRFSEKAAGHVILILAVGNFQPRYHEPVSYTHLTLPTNRE